MAQFETKFPIQHEAKFETGFTSSSDVYERLLDSLKTPYIGENGNWYEWDVESQSFVDTGVKSQGEDGEAPVKGVDYWTDEDKQEIIDEIPGGVVDQTYIPHSENAQSGKAVAEGIEMTANGLEIGISEAKNIGYAAQEQANYAQQIAERVDVYVGVDLTNRINDLEAQVGNFDTVLNQLHNYAQSLIGGVA